MSTAALAAVVILSQALGTGANTTIFSVMRQYSNGDTFDPAKAYASFLFGLTPRDPATMAAASAALVSMAALAAYAPAFRASRLDPARSLKSN